MFINITKEKTPIGCENFLSAYKRGAKEFTPRAAMELLRATNFKRSINDMLELIGKQPPEQQAKFKEIICAVADGRIQPPEIKAKAYGLAALGGYVKDMEAADAGWKWLKSAPARTEHIRRIKVTGDEFVADESLKSAGGCLLEGKGNYCYIKHCENLPELLIVRKLEAVFCSEDLSGIKRLIIEDCPGIDIDVPEDGLIPPGIDFSGLKRITLRSVDLAGQTVQFKPRAELDFSSVENVPAGTDFSKCSDAHLYYCDLSALDEAGFTGAADIYRSKMPLRIDLTRCKDEFSLSECDYTQTKEIFLTPQQNMCFLGYPPSSAKIIRIKKGRNLIQAGTPRLGGR